MDDYGDASDVLTVKGHTLDGITKRRIIVPPTNGNGYEEVTGKQESIMKQFVKSCLVEPIQTNRKVSNLIIAKDLSRGKADKWRSRYENLADKLKEIGEYSELGWDVTLDYTSKSFVFDVIEGKVLTTSQSELPPVIISLDFNSLLSREYIENSSNHKNAIYAGGKGEEENRLIIQRGDCEGFERVESFENLSSAEDVTELTSLAELRLIELEKVKSFDAKLDNEGSFRYGEDFSLGDVVTFQDRKLKITMDARIVEVRDIYDMNGYETECVFGNKIPTILDVIKDKQNKAVI